ncbi:MAG TPA: hypothetical protein VNH18_03945 [Bryobacteraceae bacterium]|nr:hypothetical protein [Bryobacteraceae bacterium]
MGARLCAVTRSSGTSVGTGGSDPFAGAVENFRFFDLQLYDLTDVQGAVAEVKGEGLIKSTGRMYRQDYVVFLRVVEGKIAFMREYFDPVRAAKALDAPILGLES